MPKKSNTPNAEDLIQRQLDHFHFNSAEAAVRKALIEKRMDADLNAQLASILLHTQRETQAIEPLKLAKGSKIFKSVAQKLTDYFHCRSLMAKKLGHKDNEGEAFAKTLQEFSGCLPSKYGIKLSACLITKNEEKFLEACLDSIKDVVDEIVVVDTGSTDNTVKIAEKFGAKISTFEWCEDFSAARNASLDLCKGDWILWVDADEVLEKGSKVWIEEALMRPHFAGYGIPIVNYVDEECLQEYVHTPTRLFRKLPQTRFTGKIHEQIATSLAEVDLPFATIEKARIKHYGYTPSMLIERHKQERTIRMLEAELRENPSEAFQWFNLANAHALPGNYREAEYAARMAMRHLRPREPWVPTLFHLLSGILTSQGRQQEALVICDEADALSVGGLLNEYERAQALHQLGRDSQALAVINHAITLPWPVNLAGDYTIFTYKRHLLKGQVLMNLGRNDEAVETLDSVMSQALDQSPLLLMKATALERLLKLDDAIDIYNGLSKSNAYGAHASKGLGRIYLHLGKFAEAAAYFRNAWTVNNGDSDSWVAWVHCSEQAGDAAEVLAAYEAFVAVQEPATEVLVNWGRSLEANGQFDKALSCYSEAMKRDPANANAYFNCGDLLYKSGAFADAAHLYEGGLRCNPAFAQGWFVLGNSLAQLGIQDGAKLAYKQCLAFAPDHEEAAHNLTVCDEAAA